MTRGELGKFVERFSMGHGALRALGVEMEVVYCPCGSVTCSGAVIKQYFTKIPDRDDGHLGVKPSVFTHNVYFRASEPLSEERVAGAIRQGLKDGLAHEVDESLLLDGRRIFDPHA